MNEFKDWYNSLYRGQRYLVNAVGILLTISIIAWVTNTPSERKQPKLIILAPK